GDVPSTKDNQVTSKVAVHDRESVLLGGFVLNEASKSHSGVPVLKDIPGLGFLFRSSSNTRSRQELMILIRPTILDTPQIAGDYTKAEQLRHGPVPTALNAFDYDERRYEEDAIKEEAKQKARDAKRNKGAGVPHPLTAPPGAGTGELGVSCDGNGVVSSLSKGNPLALAGVQVGDRIVAVNGADFSG